MAAEGDIAKQGVDGQADIETYAVEVEWEGVGKHHRRQEGEVLGKGLQACKVRTEVVVVLESVVEAVLEGLFLAQQPGWPHEAAELQVSV